VIRIGVLTPHAAVGPEEELPAMAPGRLVTRVVRISAASAAGLPSGSPPTSAEGLRALTLPPLLDDAAKILGKERVDVIGYASTTSAYAIGFDAEAAMVSRISELLTVPVVATCASAVRALNVLGIERVALIGAPWFSAELNELGAAYFRSRGFDVVSSISAGLPLEPDRIEAAAIYDWTSQHVAEDAQAIFIGGNGFRALAAVKPLEDVLDRPVLTSNQVLLWNLLGHLGATFTVHGFGRLLEHRANPESA
jgi:maleate isomerase